MKNLGFRVPFLAHSYQSKIPTKFRSEYTQICSDPLGMCGGEYSTRFSHVWVRDLIKIRFVLSLPVTDLAALRHITHYISGLPFSHSLETTILSSKSRTFWCCSQDFPEQLSFLEVLCRGVSYLLRSPGGPMLCSWWVAYKIYFLDEINVTQHRDTPYNNPKVWSLTNWNPFRFINHSVR